MRIFYQIGISHSENIKKKGFFRNLENIFTMNKVTLKNIKTAVQSLSGNEFQNFIDCFYLIIYRSGFQPVKQKRDKGCDGIINNEIVIAVYAPENYDTRAFERKYRDDFDKY
jgi:hypothetical protein